MDKNYTIHRCEEEIFQNGGGEGNLKIGREMRAGEIFLMKPLNRTQIRHGPKKLSKVVAKTGTPLPPPSKIKSPPTPSQYLKMDLWRILPCDLLTEKYFIYPKITLHRVN